MKKILALIMVLFLASCALGPGEASSKQLEDIQVTVSPPAANYKVELYSQSVLMGTATTSSKGIAIFYKLPVGAYKTVIFSPSGVKVTEKYLTSVYVSGPTPFKSFVNVPAIVPPTTPPITVVTPPSPTPVVVTVPTPPPVQICTPNQITCKNANTKSVCNAAGTAVTDTVCTASTNKCSAGIGCVECTVPADCASGNCQNNVCVSVSACVRCPYPRTDCKWVFKNLCTPLGEGGYPTCTAFIFYNPNAPCSWGNILGIVPTDPRGSVNVAGRLTPAPIYPQYECCLAGVTTTPAAPSAPIAPIVTTPAPVPVHCPNGVVEPALGEECEPPNTATCDANCKLIPEPQPPVQPPVPVLVSSVDTAALIQCYAPGQSGGHLTWFGRGYTGCSGVPLETSLGFLLTKIPSSVLRDNVVEINICQHTYGGSGTSPFYENEIAFGALCSPETRVSEYSEPVRREFVGYAFKSYVPGTRLAYKCAKTAPLYNFRVSFDSKCHDDNYYTTDIWGVRTYPWKDYVNVGTLGYWPTKSSLP